MHLDSSLEEGLSLLYSFFESHMDPPNPPGAVSISMQPSSSATSSSRYEKVQDQSALITPAPELRLRNAVPEPQADPTDCQQAAQSASQAAQSASQAVQQANQQASDSIRQATQQASQSASQAAQQASQSASQAIQQFSNQLSQSIDAASRSVASAISSASFAIASAQSSADAAISQANASMQAAQSSASSAQSDASKAVLQAGAAVAAATGSAAAAGSSFLAAAAKATQSAQASVSAIAAGAASQVSQASQQVTASQNAAVTATQAALAIVGSIIASTLITILIYFLIIRHKNLAKRRSLDHGSPGAAGGFGEPKFPISAQVGSTIAASQSNYDGANKNDPTNNSQRSFSLFRKPIASDKSLRASVVKTTEVPWDPTRPPRAPTLGSWLKVQEGVSPFGPINLPPDRNSNSPLGGQLKSPLQSIPVDREKPKSSPRMTSAIPIAIKSPSAPSYLGNISSITAVPRSPLLLPLKSSDRQQRPEISVQYSSPGRRYRESKASVWTDEIPSPSPSSLLQSPPAHLRGPRARPAAAAAAAPATVTRGYSMEIPTPQNPVRNTAEWLAAREDQRAYESSSISDPWRPNAIPSRLSNNRSSNTGLPRGPKSGFGFGLPKIPGPTRIKSMDIEPEVESVQGLNRFLGDEKRGSNLTLSRNGSQLSTAKSVRTPGVGKAL